MEWPQITMIVLISITIYRSILNHGKERKLKYHFIADTIGIAVLQAILYFGGFWT